MARPCGNGIARLEVIVEALMRQVLEHEPELRKASSADTGGALMMFEERVVRGKTTPLHTHPNELELIYVLEGEILAHVDGDERRIGQRGLLVVSAGVPHAFLVTSETGRLLALQTPGTGEAFFRAASEPATSEDDPRPADFGRLREAA